MTQFSPTSSSLISEWRLNAELLGCIVWRLFPHVQLMGGGVNSLGFYYDFVFRQPLAKEMVELIEIELYRFIKEEHPIRFLSMMRENAKVLFEHHHHMILADKAGSDDCNIVELIKIGDYHSLCPELQFASTSEAGVVRLLACEEIGNVNEFQYTRLVGTSRPHAKELKAFIKIYDAFIKKKDHRTLGPKLKLFSFSDPISSFGITWHPKGALLRQILINLLEQITGKKATFSTPLVLQEDTATSERSLPPFEFEGKEYVLRSSFLLQHLQTLKYLTLEELPWEIHEMGTLFSLCNETQRWGLFNTNSYICDHTTICCRKEQVIPELISSLHFIEQIITIFDFRARWILVVGPLKSPKHRQEKQAIDWLKQAYREGGCSLPLNLDLLEEDEGGDSPRLELRISDALGREWEFSTIRMVGAIPMEIETFNPPEEKLQASLVLFTRQIVCSLERFVALLLEHYEGMLPFWLSPEHVRVIAIGEANKAYAKELSSRLEQKGFRVRLDLRQSKLGMRIHEAEKENVPYLLLIGEQERLKQKISVRKAGQPNHNSFTDLETFLKEVPKLGVGPFLLGESESA